jgi:hypothetical protein
LASRRAHHTLQGVLGVDRLVGVLERLGVGVETRGEVLVGSDGGDIGAVFGGGLSREPDQVLFFNSISFGREVALMVLLHLSARTFAIDFLVQLIQVLRVSRVGLPKHLLAPLAFNVVLGILGFLVDFLELLVVDIDDFSGVRPISFVELALSLLGASDALLTL